ncbi:MAG: dTDP-4-dehydrorhamnose 3,5-epimerase [Eubacteriales bacterium]|nr:dTDP-4-dehydrorhamnose 3,5-epimerase [Eubacteriales bacterium]
MAKIIRIDTSIDGLTILEPKIFADKRGYFMETYNRAEFSEIGLHMTFVQDNESQSKKGVLRGLHFQTKYPQGKLVRVLQGSVFDVGVDLRKGSPTYGKWEGVVLSEQNKRMFYVSEGFAHGFLVLSDIAVFSYKCTNLYYPEYDGGIRYDDEEIGIDWPARQVGEVVLSEKDKKLPALSELKIMF